jgi:hypothetical protein
MRGVTFRAAFLVKARIRRGQNEKCPMGGESAHVAFTRE